MPYVNANKTEAAMTELDQEKTFESVDWNFLLKALQHFGHGSKIILKKKTSLSEHRNTDKGKRTLVASFSSEERTAARTPVICDSVRCICRNILRAYKTKQFHQRYCNR